MDTTHADRPAPARQDRPHLPLALAPVAGADPAPTSAPAPEAWPSRRRPPTRWWRRRGLAGAWLDHRRLKAVGVVLPVAFVMGLELIRERISAAGTAPETYRATFFGVTVVGIAAFAHLMFRAIDRTQRDLERKNDEVRAFNEILLAISRQRPATQVLDQIVSHARTAVGAEEAVLCLDTHAAALVQHDQTSYDQASHERTSSPARGENPRSGRLPTAVHLGHPVCPVRSATDCTRVAVPVTGPAGRLGELWVARGADLPFTTRDRDHLAALAGLAGVAVASAQERDTARQGAIVDERERIAREMHDSLAQVLGATHLRLRALDRDPSVRGSALVAAELSTLADICDDAFHDVREAILGLRHTRRSERGLQESLDAYLAKYSAQCGIRTTLASELDHDLALSPSAEVQMIRVIQEALTNVRKHSGAARAIVRITETAAGTRFVVEDDGRGFVQGEADRSRFGLFTMRERLDLLGGSLILDSAPGRGTRVIADVPERSTCPTPEASVSSLLIGHSDPHREYCT